MFNNSICNFITNEKIKTLLQIDDKESTLVVNNIDIDITYLSKINQTDYDIDLYEWVLITDNNPTLFTTMFHIIHNSNKHGILVDSRVNIENLYENTYTKYIRDIEYEKFFNNNFIILRKIYHYTQANYKLCLLHNKPSNLNTFINDFQKPNLIGNYLSNYRRYFNKCDKNDFMIDIGANIGLSACPILSLGNRVVCFEPEFLNVEILKHVKKCNNYSNMFIEHKAVVSNYLKKTTTLFSNLNREDNSSLNRKCCTNNVSTTSVIEKEVDCITLDEWYDNNKEQFDVKNLLLLKIDVQGGEYDILKGAVDLLKLCSSNKKCFVEIECDNGFMKLVGIDFQVISDFMKSCGFVCESKGYDSIFVPIQ